MEMPRGNLALATTLAAVVILAGTNAFLFVPGLTANGKASSAPGSVGGFLLEEPELPSMQATRSTLASASFSTAAIVLALGGLAVRQAASQISRRCAAARSSRSTMDIVACHAFENELGVQAPTGFWDPLGFTKDGDESKYKRRRSSELKHGRISMLACMGYITPEYFRFPGYCSYSENVTFADIPNGLEAMSKMPLGGGLQMFLFGGFIETLLFVQDSERAPGDFANAGRLGIPGDEGIINPEARKRSLNAEIANGRLAMFAIMGMMFQNGFIGTTGPDMWLGKAFEGELGVQAPVGFWDPLGFSKDGDVAVYKRRRASELKHGRICMLACMGYLTPEYFRFPGYLSPSQDLSFVDMPNGLEAMAKMPIGGGLQMFIFGGFIETLLFQQSADRAPGDFENAGRLGIVGDEGMQNPEARKRSLNAEIANGRLAMFAIMGMMFQDGFIGGTGPEMWMGPAAFEGELGVQAPMGYWDPFGLSSDGDADAFYRRRCTEIKHGRVCMWAAMGYIVPEYIRWPGYLSPSLDLKFEDVPNGLEAFSQVPAAGWAQMFLFCGFMELFNAKQDPSNPPGMLTGNDDPFSKCEYGKLGLFRGARISDPEKKKSALNSELANGRLAMFAIMGMMFQNGVTGTTGSEMWLGAFESELGIQAPVGFFDPLGLSKDGDVATFKRRRASELKHGRICMLACMGYITPEYFRFPGMLSYKEDLAFVDMPNGLEAMAKMPLAGGLQMFIFGGFIETLLFTQDGDRAPGDFANAGRLGMIGDEGMLKPEERKRSLNAEIANGRLAMFAIMGMMFQNGFIGGTGPEMWLPSAFEGELGVQAPMGYWDPLGLSKDGDADVFYRRRCTEIKHGRVCMWAAMGFIVPEYIRWPGYLSPSLELKFDDVPSGLEAFSKVPPAGWAQMFLFCGFMELFNAKQDPSNPPGMLTGNDGAFGKVEFGNFGLFRGGRISDPEAKKRRLNSELANGRLAMFAITGMLFQNGVTGTTGSEMWLGGGAFENELGVQAPMGYWDPFGVSKDGDSDAFYRRRCTEIKHGRVSMWAAMGYIVPEYVRWPGYCSPSLDLKFADIPSGLEAFSKVPAAGWAQMFLFCGFMELFNAKQDPSNPPGMLTGNEGPFGSVEFGKLGLFRGARIDDPEKKKRALNSELANGRLAMFAIMGMMFQNGVTGTTGGEMWLGAFETELGVQSPVGFWDPVGFAADGDAQAFRRRRTVELKHGRVSMLATIGYMVPEGYRLPGYLSPSEGITFDDMPNGLAALSKVPALGIAQFVLFVGFIERSFYSDDPTRAPGDYAKAGVFGYPDGSTITDPAEKRRKLNVELANGRLAMTAIMALFFQNGTIGSTGPDMWIPAVFVKPPLM